MTATNYLIERILEINQMKEANELTELMANYWVKKCIKRAQKIEKQQAFRDFKAGQNSMEEGGKSFDKYYNETYCNKSDYHIEQHLEVISAKTEIENKLQEAAETNSEKHHYAFGQQSEFYQIGFIEGAQWYRKQLKKRQ